MLGNYRKNCKKRPATLIGAVALSAVLALVLVGCGAPGAVTFEEPVNVRVTGGAVSDGRWAEEGEFGSRVISDRAQLDSELEGMSCIVRAVGVHVPKTDTAYYEDTLGGFDDAFFEDRVLIDAHVELGSGGQRFDVAGVTVRDGLCTVTVALRPMIGGGTADMADYCVLVPVARESAEGADAVAVEIKRYPWQGC